jgi:hypothetical protein
LHYLDNISRLNSKSKKQHFTIDMFHAAYAWFSILMSIVKTLNIHLDFTVFTTGAGGFAEGSRLSAKALRPSAKALPRAVLSKAVSAKTRSAKPSLRALPRANAALGKEKAPLTGPLSLPVAHLAGSRQSLSFAECNGHCARQSWEMGIFAVLLPSFAEYNDHCSRQRQPLPRATLGKVGNFVFFLLIFHFITHTNHIHYI